MLVARSSQPSTGAGVGRRQGDTYRLISVVRLCMFEAAILEVACSWQSQLWVLWLRRGSMRRCVGVKLVEEGCQGVRVRVGTGSSLGRQ